MKNQSLAQPAFLVESFSCPYCNIASHQIWGCATDMSQATLNPFGENVSGDTHDDYMKPWVSVNHMVFTEGVDSLTDWVFSKCSHCKKLSLWYKGQCIYPKAHFGDEHHDHMPEAVAVLYDEAQDVAMVSPRSAAALLRVAEQELVRHILINKQETSTGNLHNDIEKLSKLNGASPMSIKALEILRYEGNQSSHPGEINLNEDPDTAAFLFALLNIVTEAYIAEPKRVDTMFENIPISKRIGI